MLRSVILITVALLTGARPSLARQESSAAPSPGFPVPGMAEYSVQLGLDRAGHIQSLLIFHGADQVQSLDVCSEEPVPREEKVGTLAVTDYNFDGFPDLALQVAADRNKNDKFCIWLFDPQARRYVASPELSGLTNARPDPNTRTVYSFTNMDCLYCYVKKNYAWKDGRLELARVETMTVDPLTGPGSGACNFVLSIQEPQNGRLKLVSSERVNSSGVRCIARD